MDRYAFRENLGYCLKVGMLVFGALNMMYPNVGFCYSYKILRVKKSCVE